MYTAPTWEHCFWGFNTLDSCHIVMFFCFVSMLSFDTENGRDRDRPGRTGTRRAVAKEGVKGGKRGTFRTPNPNKSQKDGPYGNCSHFWHIFWFFSKTNIKNYLLTMFLYSVQYNESEYDIQNNDLLNKNTKNAKTFSKSWKVNRLLIPQNRHA